MLDLKRKLYLAAQRRRARRGDQWAFFQDPWFLSQPIRTVVDVGANRGQSITLFRGLWPDARIVAVEPIPELHTQLQRKFKDDPNLSLHNCALGQKPGRARFNVLKNSATSSILNPMPDLARSGIDIKPVEQIEVEVNTLDALAREENLSTIDFLKIDTQGYDLEVLRGAEKIRPAVRFLKIEMFVTPAYEGAPLFPEIHAQLMEWGFELSSVAADGRFHHPLRTIDAFYTGPALKP